VHIFKTQNDSKNYPALTSVVVEEVLMMVTSQIQQMPL
jgi:hypothetical protein